jgi:unsaturated rhamnogalacturonyl hydrolase
MFTSCQVWLTATLLSCTLWVSQTQAQEMTRAQIITEAEKTALAHFDQMKWDFRHRSWKHGTFWAGVTDLSKVSNNPKIHEAIKKFSESGGVRIGVGVLERHDKNDPLHADDACVGQTFLDYYVKTKNSEVLADTKRQVDAVTEYILSDEAADKAAHFKELGTHEGLTWSWIDALFMAAPLHARFSVVSGDPKYLQSAIVEWKRVSDNLYDKEEHLYYRDKNFLTKKSRNGKKVFWSRGNGWVMAAFAHILPYIPEDHPDRPWFIAQFTEMATKLASIQQPNGTWSPSMIDYDHFPYSEMSATAFNCFAMAWGINNKILDEKLFLPVVEKSWAALLAARTEEGFLGYIQGVGAEPASVKSTNWDTYGNGGFLMAATELSKMAPITLLPAPQLSKAD